MNNLLQKNEEQKILTAQYTRKYYSSCRSLVIALLGGKCVRCGFTDERALQIDHINFVGKNRETLMVRFRNIMSGKTANYQLLCANCNAIKKHENREYPIKYFELEDKQ